MPNRPSRMVSPTSSLVAPIMAISTSWMAVAPWQTTAVTIPRRHRSITTGPAADLDHVPAHGHGDRASCPPCRDDRRHRRAEPLDAQKLRQRVQPVRERDARLRRSRDRIHLGQMPPVVHRMQLELGQVQATLRFGFPCATFRSHALLPDACRSPCIPATDDHAIVPSINGLVNTHIGRGNRYSHQSTAGLGTSMRFGMESESARR